MVPKHGRDVLVWLDQSPVGDPGVDRGDDRDICLRKVVERTARANRKEQQEAP